MLRLAERPAVDILTILAPILPHTTQKLHEYLGYEGQFFGTQQVVEYREEIRSLQVLTYGPSDAVGTWASCALREPAPLFKKLDEGVAEREHAPLGG